MTLFCKYRVFLFLFGALVAQMPSGASANQTNITGLECRTFGKCFFKNINQSSLSSIQTNEFLTTDECYTRLFNINGSTAAATDAVKFFSVHSERLAASEAKKSCIAKGGQLAKIESEQENIHLQCVRDSTLSSGIRPVWMWIGLERIQEDILTFAWLDGSKVSYTRWHAAQPNFVSETCVLICNDATWYDALCHWNHPYACYMNVSLLSSVITETTHDTTSTSDQASTQTSFLISTVPPTIDPTTESATSQQQGVATTISMTSQFKSISTSPNRAASSSSFYVSSTTAGQMTNESTLERSSLASYTSKTATTLQPTKATSQQTVPGATTPRSAETNKTYHQSTTAAQQSTTTTEEVYTSATEPLIKITLPLVMTLPSAVTSRAQKTTATMLDSTTTSTAQQSTVRTLPANATIATTTAQSTDSPTKATTLQSMITSHRSTETNKTSRQPTTAAQQSTATAMELQSTSSTTTTKELYTSATEPPINITLPLVMTLPSVATSRAQKSTATMLHSTTTATAQQSTVRTPTANATIAAMTMQPATATAQSTDSPTKATTLQSTKTSPWAWSTETATTAQQSTTTKKEVFTSVTDLATITTLPLVSSPKSTTTTKAPQSTETTQHLTSTAPSTTIPVTATLLSAATTTDDFTSASETAITTTLPLVVIPQSTTKALIPQSTIMSLSENATRAATTLQRTTTTSQSTSTRTTIATPQSTARTPRSTETTMTLQSITAIQQALTTAMIQQSTATTKEVFTEYELTTLPLVAISQSTTKAHPSATTVPQSTTALQSTVTSPETTATTIQILTVVPTQSTAVTAQSIVTTEDVFTSASELSATTTLPSTIPPQSLPTTLQSTTMKLQSTAATTSTISQSTAMTSGSNTENIATTTIQSFASSTSSIYSDGTTERATVEKTVISVNTAPQDPLSHAVTASNSSVPQTVSQSTVASVDRMLQSSFALLSKLAGNVQVDAQERFLYNSLNASFSLQSGGDASFHSIVGETNGSVEVAVAVVTLPSASASLLTPQVSTPFSPFALEIKLLMPLKKFVNVVTFPPLDRVVVNYSMVVSSATVDATTITSSSSYGRTGAVQLQSASVVCAYLNETNNSWSTFGLHTTMDSGGRLLCSSNHTTIFSALLSVTALVIPKEAKILTYLLESISVVSLVVTAIVLIRLKKKLRSERTVVQINLLFALICFHVIVLFHDLALLNARACELVAVSTHYFILASAFWMLIEGITLVTKTIDSALRYGTSRRAALVRFFFGWGFPALIVTIATAITFPANLYMQKNPALLRPVKGIGPYKKCWIARTPGIFVGSLLVPVGMTLLLNFLIMTKVGTFVFCMSKKTESFKPTSERVSARNIIDQNAEHLKASLKATLFLLPALGVPWFFLFLSGVHPAVVYINIILNGLQGFFLLLIYCVFNKDVCQQARIVWRRSKLDWKNRFFFPGTVSTNIREGGSSTPSDPSKAVGK